MEDLILSKELTLNSKKSKFIDMLETELTFFNRGIEDDISLMYHENYITYMDCLRLVNPESKILNQSTGLDCNIELDSEILDYWLVREPLHKAGTIKHNSDFYAKTLRESLDYNYSLDTLSIANIVGLDFRAVYNEGYLLSARLFGKTGLGLDITNQINFLLGEYKAELVDYELCEIRGKITSMTAYSSSDMRNTIKTVLNKLLDYKFDSELLCLIIIVDNILSDKTFDLTLNERLEKVKECNFKTPLLNNTTLNRYDFIKNLDDYILQMDLMSTDYKIQLSGVKVFNNLDCTLLCNLEFGRWRVNSYEGEIEVVEWVTNSCSGDLEPYAKLVEPLSMQDGKIIHEIPLYNPANILILEAYKGNPIHFRYGTKVGALPVSKDYRLVLSKGVCL